MALKPDCWRLLIVEDDAANADHIAQGFRALGHSAQVCGDGVQAIAQVTDHDWDIVILDRMLPDGVDGLSVLATLRNLGKSTPVLVLSALSALDDRVDGLKAGGDDYLTKPFAFAELAARTEALLRRARREPEVRRLQIGDLRVDLFERIVERAGRQIILQPREFRLLVFFMMHPGQLLTRSMLLEAVWHYRFDPQTNVVDVQVSRLRAKIDTPGVAQLIHTVRGAGYRMSDGVAL
ncbi:MAG: response regulator transcription factor [Burkholderiaceae bacterium]